LIDIACAVGHSAHDTHLHTYTYTHTYTHTKISDKLHTITLMYGMRWCALCGAHVGWLVGAGGDR